MKQNRYNEHEDGPGSKDIRRFSAEHMLVFHCLQKHGISQQ